MNEYSEIDQWIDIGKTYAGEDYRWLNSADPYVCWMGGNCITLDGGFSVEELKQIVKFMEEGK